MQYKHELEEVNVDIETGYFPVLAIMVLFAISFAMIWTLVLRSFPKTTLYVALVLPCVLLAAGAALCFKTGSTAGGIGCLAMLALQLLYLWFVRDRLPFTATLLKETTQVMHKYPGTVLVSMGSLIPGACAIFFYILAFAIVKHDLHDRDGSQGEGVALSLGMSFSFYWTFAVLGNVVHTTICGVVARWYIMEGETGATAPALKQSMTSSFGPIALGSFILAAIKTVKLIIRYIIESAKETDNLALQILALALDCVMSCIQSLVEFVSTYAYVYVAMYGTSFCEGARETYTMMQETGIDMIVAYDFSSAVSFLGGLVCAGLTALSTWGVIHCHGAWLPSSARSTYSGDVKFLPAYLIFAAFTGLGAALMVSSIIESGACTLLVCLGESPQLAKERCPELAEQVEELDEADRARKEAEEQAELRRRED
jgi:hypothetical protein